MPWEAIQANTVDAWDFLEVSKNPHITLQTIVDCPATPWRFVGLCESRNFTLDILRGMMGDKKYFKYNVGIAAA